MGLVLEKGQRLNLSKEAAGQDYFVVGMGWSEGPYDLDTFAVLCKQQPDGTSKVVGEPGFIYFNQLTSSCRGVRHMGDNLTGAGDGDDEQILIDVKNLDSGVDQIDIFCTVFKARERGHNFGMVNKAYVRIGSGTRGGDGNPVTVPGQSNADMTEIARFDLSEDYSTHTAVQAGSLYKKDGEWRFQAMGAGLGKVEIGDIFEQYAPGITK